MKKLSPQAVRETLAAMMEIDIITVSLLAKEHKIKPKLIKEIEARIDTAQNADYKKTLQLYVKGLMG